MTHYSGVAFISHWQRFTTKPEKKATLKPARPRSWRTSLPLKFIMFSVAGKLGGGELTAEGQYPNSSRNSSGFSTTDSVHILTAVSLLHLRRLVDN